MFRFFKAPRRYLNQVPNSEAATGGVVLKKGVLKYFAKFTGRHKCFLVDFVKFLRTLFSQNLFKIACIASSWDICVVIK